MSDKPPSSPSTDSTADLTWDPSSAEQLTPSAQRLRDLAREMDEAGKADLAGQIDRAADAMNPGQSASDS